MSHAPNSNNGHDWQTSNSQNARLRTIVRASLYLNGALILATYLPIPALMVETLLWIGLSAALIGIAVMARLVWVDWKHTHYG